MFRNSFHNRITGYCCLQPSHHSLNRYLAVGARSLYVVCTAAIGSVDVAPPIAPEDNPAAQPAGPNSKPAMHPRTAPPPMAHPISSTKVSVACVTLLERFVQILVIIGRAV